MTYTSTFGSSTTASGTGINYATNTTWSSRLSLGGNTSGALIGGAIDTRAIAHVSSAIIYTRIAGNCTLAAGRISLNDSDIGMTSGSRVFSSSSYNPSTSSPNNINSINTTIYNASSSSRTGMYAGFVNLDIASRSNIGYYTGSGASDNPIAPTGTGIGSLNAVYRNTTSISTAGSIYGQITWGTVPTAPVGFTSSTTSNSVTLNWTTAPDNNGGDAINGWRVLYAVSGSGTWNTTGKLSGNGSTTSLTVSGLSPSTTYVFRVSALNATTDAINGSSYSSTSAIVGTSSGQITATTTSAYSASFDSAYDARTGDTLSGRVNFVNTTGSNVTVTIKSSVTTPVSSQNYTAYANSTTAINWTLTGLAANTSYTVVATVGSTVYATAAARSTLVAGTISSVYSSHDWRSISVTLTYTNNMSTVQEIETFDTTEYGLTYAFYAAANTSSSRTVTVTELAPVTSYIIRSRFTSYTTILANVTQTTAAYPVTYSYVAGSITSTGDKITGQLQITNTANYTVSGSVSMYNTSTLVDEPSYLFTVYAYQNSTITFTFTGLTPSTNYTLDATDEDPYSAIVTATKTTLAPGTISATLSSKTWNSITLNVNYTNNMSTNLNVDVYDTGSIGTNTSFTAYANTTSSSLATVTDLQSSTSSTIRARYSLYTTIFSNVTAITDVFPVTYTFNPANVVATADTISGYVDIVNTSNQYIDSVVYADNVDFMTSHAYYFTVYPYQNSTMPFTITGVEPNSGFDVYVGDINGNTDDYDSVVTKVIATLTNTYVSSTSSSITVSVGWVNNSSNFLTLEVDDITGVGTLQSFSLPPNNSGTTIATVPDLLPSTTYTIRARIPAVISVNSTGTTTAAPVRVWRVWNGSAWSTGASNGIVKYWTGSSWVQVSGTRVWDGSTWV